MTGVVPDKSDLLIISFLLYVGAMRWTVDTLNDTVDAEIEALPNDMRSRLVRLSNIIEQVGFQGLPRDAVKHLEGPLWDFASLAGTEFRARSISRLRSSVS